MQEIPLPDGARLMDQSNGHPTLAELKPGDRAIVCCVRPNQPSRRRLMEMGFVSGTNLKLVRAAPLGDPLQVEMRGYQLSLRVAEARGILVRPA